jgi:DNA-binding transcriptional ArsR family regulator
METLIGVFTRRAWNEADLEKLRLYSQQKGWASRPKSLVNTLEWWSRPDEFGERYLAALQAYFAVFFAEEERRIYPVLQQALARAQEMATQLNFPSLVVELSQGVMIAALAEAAEVVLVPSYWTTPLVMYEHVTAGRMLLLFGGRPAEVALVPGEMVPDAMLRALNALSDSTRLRILRYLTDQPLTPSQLSRRLRLRAPTVIHHLSALRLAGLVYVSLDVEGEKRYTIRETAVGDTFESLRKFLAVRDER